MGGAAPGSSCKAVDFLSVLLGEHTRLPRVDAEAGVGFLLWRSQAFPRLRPWMACFYAILKECGDTLLGIDPRNMSALSRHLSAHLGCTSACATVPQMRPTWR